MAAVYVDEEEVWKCPKHPSKRRKSGICPVCLRERLVILCPECANVRPCGCCATATTSSSSSSSSSSRFTGGDGVRVSKLLESEPSFRRSRSVAIPFLRSRSRFVGGGGGVGHVDFDRSEPHSGGGRTKTPSFWSSMFRSSQRSKRSEANGEHETTPEKKVVGEIEEVEDADAAMRRNMMRKSRSVAVPMMSSNSGAAAGERPPAKGRGWYFPSPIKAFRHSKISKIVSERSPVYRG